MKNSSSFKLTRRKFVATGSAVVVSAGLGGVGHAAFADYTISGIHRAGRLSIAYLQGSENWDHLHGLTPTLAAVTDDMIVDKAPLVGASSLAKGDSGFTTRGARITIHGLIAEPSSLLPPMLLKAHYLPYHDTTHIAWSFEGSSSNTAPAGSSFTVPVDASNGLRLSLEMQPSSSNSVAGSPTVADAQFVLGATSGEAKLRRGAYLLTWGLADAPMLFAWTGCHVVAERIEMPEEGMPETRCFMVADAAGKPRSLPALMLTVEYADGTAS